MKKFPSLSLLLNLAIALVITTATSCSTELVQPEDVSVENTKLNQRSDFSGYEEQVKVKVSQRDQISVSSINSCYYYGQTSDGYGRYHFTTNLGFGIYTVTGIIGDDVEGW